MKIKIQFDAISEIENCVSKIDSITDNARSDWDKLDWHKRVKLEYLILTILKDFSVLVKFSVAVIAA